MILCVLAIPEFFPEFQLPLKAREYLSNTYDKWQDNQAGQPLSPQFDLKKEDFKWFSEPLYGNETDTLSIRIKNYGGDAGDMTIDMSSTLPGLSFQRSKSVPPIPKDGKETVNILIIGDINLPPTDNASIDLQLNEPNHNLKYKRRLFFETRRFRKPQLKLAGAAFEETVKEVSNNQINKNDQIELKFYVQNIGCSAAKEVEISVYNKQRETVRLLGRNEPTIFPTIDAGEYKRVAYPYLVTGEFKGRELKFEISATESFNKYGFDKEIVTVALNEELDQLIRPIKSSCDEEPYQELRVINRDVENSMQEDDYVVLDTSQVSPEDLSLNSLSPPSREMKVLDLLKGEISDDMPLLHNPTYPFKTIKLEFSMHNVSNDVVKQVEVKVENNQKGIDPFNPAPKKFLTIDSQEHERITYEYFIDKEKFDDHEFKFEIHVTYRYLYSEVLNENIDTIDTATEEEPLTWEIKRQVAPDSKTQVTLLR